VEREIIRKTRPPFSSSPRLGNSERRVRERIRTSEGIPTCLEASPIDSRELNDEGRKGGPSFARKWVGGGREGPFGISAAY
jgi:hypothetical protein